MNRIYISATILLAIIFSDVKSQDCTLVNWQGSKPFVLSKGNRANFIYDRIVGDTSSNWNVLLVRFGGLLNNQKSVYLNTCGNRLATISTDSSGETSKKLLDSIRFEKLNVALNRRDSLNGFFSGNCKDYVSYHNTEFLVIKNQKLNKWIEIYVTAGSLREVLRGKKEYEFILALYEIVDKVN